MTEVCALEAKLALMRAAIKACLAIERHDDADLALWRSRAEEAREWLRRTV